MEKEQRLRPDANVLYHPDDIVNTILQAEKWGMGIDPLTRSPEYIKKLEAFAKEQREKKRTI